jgi:hypothetical protein
VANYSFTLGTDGFISNWPKANKSLEKYSVIKILLRANSYASWLNAASKSLEQSNEKRTNPSTCQDIPSILWNLRVYSHAHKSRATSYSFELSNSTVFNFPSYFFVLHFNIIPKLYLCHLSDLFPAGFRTETRNILYGKQKPKLAFIRIAPDDLVNSHKTPDTATRVLQLLLFSLDRTFSI